MAGRVAARNELEHDGVAFDVVEPPEFVHVGVGRVGRRVVVDAVRPRALVGHVALHLPHAAVALEPGAEGHHEHPVPSLKPPLGLHVRQHVPQAARRRVPPPVQRHPCRLHVAVVQPQAPLHRLDHRRAARVQAEVVHARLKVDLRALAFPAVLARGGGELPQHEAGGEPRELGHREDARRQRPEVDGEGPDGSLGERLAQADPDAPVRVLPLLRARVRVVVGGDVGAHQAGELHLGAPAQRRVVAQQHRRPAAPEQHVAQHHRLVGAGVPVGRDGLRRHHQRRRVPPRPQRVARQVQRDQPGAASHPGQIVGGHVLPHAVPAHDPGDYGRRGGEHGHVHDQHVDVPGLDQAAALGEELGDGVVDEGVHLVHRVLVRRRVLPAVEDVARGVRLLADAGADDDTEEEAVLGQPEAWVALDQCAGHLSCHLAVVGRLVAHVVQEVASRLPAPEDGGPGQVGHRVRKEEHGEQEQQLHAG
ncbi:hypothetical protein CFC21_005153 [Triticum aestivum]|uniref:Uncharacterized protein n=2 Tax=Triticum aestivum TaxID=4565 RepID=A0A9R1D912_WHEAT|nr:hypothetical protein CFC21_005153 [Triticum aestivum]